MMSQFYSAAYRTGCPGKIIGSITSTPAADSASLMACPAAAHVRSSATTRADLPSAKSESFRIVPLADRTPLPTSTTDVLEAAARPRAMSSVVMVFSLAADGLRSADQRAEMDGVRGRGEEPGAGRRGVGGAQLCREFLDMLLEPVET